MGHAPFQYPTPDGYPLEPQPWLGTLLWRWKFAESLHDNSIKGTKIDIDEFAQRAGGSDALGAHMLGRVMTDDERTQIATSSAPFLLLLAAPAFQRH